MTSLTAGERETTVTCTDHPDDKVVRIWTARRKHLTALRRNPNFTEVASGVVEGMEWAEFTIADDRWSPATGAKRVGRKMTEEQRQAAVERLASARAAAAVAAGSGSR